MKKIIILVYCVFLWVSTTLFSQSSPYSRLYFEANLEEMKMLAVNGVALDHLIRSGKGFTGEFSSEETGIIRTYAKNVIVQVKDLTEHFLNDSKIQNLKRRALTYPIPAGFKLGSMGGYLTLDEAYALIDTMYRRYPKLVSKKDSIGTSYEGRIIYAFKVSDNPNIDENEPEILYTALHHAREPISLMQMVYYLYYLLENYKTDATVSSILNSCELYFVPCINPDGYVYNQQTNPGGGGYWRKNRRDNADTTFGVDLNRNYGYNWGLNNAGSSPNGLSETYRGTAGFSESETQSLRNFCNRRKFIAALNYHSFGDYLIYPWGDDSGPSSTPDNSTYYSMAAKLTEENNYLAGTCGETLQYLVNGSSDDWMYGEQVSKDKIFAFTPEVGSSTDGFWPPINRIHTLCDVNIRQNLNLALQSMQIYITSIIYENTKINSILIPNPASELLTIQTPLGHQIQIEIYNSTGVLVYYGSENFLDVSSLENGIYYCRIEINDEKVYNQKLIVLH